ncbi:MAG: hypothetical protein Q7R66_11740 [Undibacterium sp.]|uniref:hypothetical protein n=1 Tax=Undibacterium sp. TaxID=1914977 RepID=UPI0027249D80|nr:hypothetical protein [Undibacterium sp.]MDO8652851.1 hypothetical protein [Undibacterium sp.]
MPDTSETKKISKLPARLRFLQETLSYRQPDQALTCIETHMSWVFLIGNSVFKMKKPVRFPFLDFSTVKAREFYCREEVRLNARLAPGVYLGLMALQLVNGNLILVPEAQLSGTGETLDWLVVMRRLPAQRMLHQLVIDNAVSASEIDGLIEILSHFYRFARVAEITPDDYLSRFAHQQTLAREILLRPQFDLRGAALVVNRFDLILSQGAGRLRNRVLKRRVLEGHGDLRPEHVCLLQPPLVIDCLEFNLQMRQVDPFDEIAFLSLECAMLADETGAEMKTAWIGERLAAGLATALDEKVDPALLHLYMAHRAILRARLAMAHLLDPQPRTPEKWHPLAQRYLDRALRSMHHFNAAMHSDSP